MQNLMRTACVAVFALTGRQALAQDGPSVTVFTNVNLFDGVNETLIEDANVVVTDNLIPAVSTEDVVTAGATVIDGGGRTMTPV